MSVHAAAAGEHHGPPPAHQSSRVDARVLGMFLFIASEIMLFGSFFTALFFVRVVKAPPLWPPAGFHLPILVAGINTAILVTSSFLIISPQSDPSRGAHPDAERRLRRAVAELRGAGIDAHGQVAHPDPFTAAQEAIREERVDEIIVSTFAPEKSGWLRRDLVERLRADTGLPVEHLVAPAEVTA